MPIEAISTSNNNSLDKKRLQYFEMHLLECLKTLAYVQLIIIYLHDVSFVRLLVGSAISTVLLSKSNTQQVLLTKKRYILMLILGYNAMCIIIHTLTGVPNARSGKYLHGSLTIEFIGVQALPSRLYLIVWSCMLLVLQVLLFCLYFAESKGETVGDIQPSSDGVLSGQVVVSNIQVIRALVESWSHQGNIGETNTGSTETAAA